MRNMNVSKVLKMMLAIIIVLFAAKFYTDKGAVKNELIAVASGTSSKKVEKEKALEEAQNSKDKDGKTSKKAKNSQDKFDKSKKNQGTTGDRKYNIDYDHVLGGDINYKSGKVTGGHTLLKGDVKIVKKYGKPSKSGVYKASIEVKTPGGNWQAKTSNGGINTMFPEDWDEARVIDEINSAWENRKDLKGRDSNMWQGISKSGVLIRGYKSPRITAYPVFEGDR
jgi:mafB1